jgi:transcriptional regulator with XRE-family HTH domain
MRISKADSKTLLTGIGAEIKRRREKLGVSQTTLAKSARVHPNVVGRTARGIYNPTVLTLTAIATALGTSMVDLLHGASK